MSNNLGTSRASAGMSVDAAIAALNDADGALDAALTNPGAFTIDATNAKTLTAAEFIGNVGFKFTAAGATAACTLSVPALNALGATLKRGFFAVINDLGFALTVQKSGGQAETAPVLSAGQRSILYFDGSNVYLAVPQGTTGADGVSAGIRWAFDTSTDTASDPGAGDMRLNNAALASVTEIALSDQSTEIGNPDVSGELATWDDSTSALKGKLIVKKTTAQENYAIFAVTAAVDATTHWRFTVTHVDSAGSFSAADVLSVQFIPKGDQGAGSTVAVESDGVSVLAAASTLNFTGGLKAVDAGAGQADVSLAFFGALVKKAADQTAANYTTPTAVTWDSEVYDTDAIHDNAVNPSRLTVPAGWTRVIIRGEIVLTNCANNTFMALNKNGTSFFGRPAVNGVQVGNIIRMNCSSGPLSVTAGDYFELLLGVATDTSVDMIAEDSWFSIEKVG